MAPFRHVPTRAHRLEVVVDKLLEKNAAGKPRAPYVTHLLVSAAFLEDEVVQEDILEETKETAV